MKVMKAKTLSLRGKKFHPFGELRSNQSSVTLIVMNIDVLNSCISY